MTLNEVIKLVEASDPRDVFGRGNRTEQDAKYRVLSRICHPDLNPDHLDQAKAAFQKLSALYAKLTAPPPQVTIRSAKHSYQVENLLAAGDIADIFLATYDNAQVVLKVARDRRDSSLLMHESAVLTKIHKSLDAHDRWYFPTVFETFSFRQPGRGVRTVNVQPYMPRLFTLKQVREKYPNGVEPKHFAWMFKRVLTTLGATHRAGYVHGAITPEHVLIHTDNHGARLIDWTMAVSDQQPLKLIAGTYEKWYPQEVFQKQPVTSTLDIYMAARCGIYLLGGDPLTHVVPSSVPRRLVIFLIA